MYVKEAEEAGQMVVGIQDGDGDDGQVVAQLVEAGEPAPGGKSIYYKNTLFQRTL